MSKRQSPASVVVDFFTTAPMSETTLVYGIVKGVMKKRIANCAPISPPIRKTRTRKVNAKPSATSPLVGEVRA